MFNRYSYVLLFTAVVGLAAAGQVNATESPATPGPSVGHRPVTSGLILSANGNDITSAATSLKVGDVIGLASAYGDDKDGDADKAGAYCVWYRVDPNTGTETEAKKPVATDRNCHYTVQSADAGFKIKNTITIFSDQDIATANGFTINPIDSWPVDTISANVVTGVAPFEVIFDSGSYVEISYWGNNNHMPEIQKRYLLTPADIIKITGDTYRLNVSAQSIIRDVRIDTLTLGRCLASSGFVLTGYIYGEVDGLESPLSAMNQEYNAVASDAVTGVSHKYFSIKQTEQGVGAWDSFNDAGPVPVFPDDAVDSSDNCSGIYPNLNTMKSVSWMYQGEFEMNLAPATMPGTGPRDYHAVYHIMNNDSLINDGNISINIHLRQN
ncbi:hypothetical protein KDR40_004862 [Salmonella enterica subsp. enterica serovar Saintpaul]|nr:hypothetical protein [Salmonella enterica subsp. enterica serovar Saintpaul]